MKGRGLLAGVLLLAAVGLFCCGNSLKMPSKPPAAVEIKKAPEQTEALVHPDFVKEEYVSVLPEGTNLALEGKIEASSFTQSYVPRKCIDGRTKGPSYWEGEPDTYPNTLTLDLKEEKSFHAVRLALSPDSLWGERSQEISVEISADGEDFTTLAERQTYAFSPDTGNEIILEPGENTARFIRLTFYANTGAKAGQLAEFEVYGS